jgi:glutathione S-transferase
MASSPSLLLVEIGACDEPGFESWSPFCLKAHRALVVAGLRYRRAVKTLPSQAKPYNPTGQYPSLVVDGQSVPDSSDILRKLDELSGGKLTVGLQGAAVGEAWLYEELGDATVNGYLLASRWADDENYPRTRDAILSGIPKLVRGVAGMVFRGGVVKKLVARDVWRAGPAACWRRFSETLDALEARAPEKDFWMGTPSPTIADLGLFGQLQSVRTRVTPRQRGWVEARPRLRGWLDRVDAVTQGSGKLVDA